MLSRNERRILIWGREREREQTNKQWRRERFVGENLNWNSQGGVNLWETLKTRAQQQLWDICLFRRWERMNDEHFFRFMTGTQMWPRKIELKMLLRGTKPWLVNGKKKEMSLPVAMYIFSWAQLNYPRRGVRWETPKLSGTELSRSFLNVAVPKITRSSEWRPCGGCSFACTNGRQPGKLLFMSFSKANTDLEIFPTNLLNHCHRLRLMMTDFLSAPITISTFSRYLTGSLPPDPRFFQINQIFFPSCYSPLRLGVRFPLAGLPPSHPSQGWNFVSPKMNRNLLRGA